MNSLELTKLHFTLQFHADTQLPPFIGNTIRGAFGHALFGCCCRWVVPRCNTCDNTHCCAYGSMFKTHSTASMPNPYIISAPYPSQRKYNKGDTIDFTLTLCGKACAFEEIIVQAASMMCEGNLKNANLISTEREYSRKWSDSGAESIETCNALTVHFLSPTEIKKSGSSVVEIDFPLFIDSLFGRISGIIDNYTDCEFIIPYNLLKMKPFVQTINNLRHRRIMQKNNMTIYGVIGDITFLGDITRYLPYIDLGSQLHIGKRTTRGCGEFTFEVKNH